MQLELGNCLDVLKTLPDNSVDSIVTDPPYGLSFMGKKWDYDVPSKEVWIECLRVLKHGGHLLAFGGTRTYHRLVVQIEDAGFEIRDQIMWIYGSGFPKSMNISKAIDKAAGVEQEVIGIGRSGPPETHQTSYNMRDNFGGEYEITKPATPEAEQWDGWGTALKPANEPICLARKPIKEKTIAANVIEHGTGALNIDKSRIPTSDSWAASGKQSAKSTSLSGGADGTLNVSVSSTHPEGRFPANVILDEEAGAMLDEQSGITQSSNAVRKNKREDEKLTMAGKIHAKGGSETYGFKDKGGASRFFYCAKAQKKEKNLGLDKNNHPTVKPVNLMRYLCRLITPPNGTVLDPFMGSGTTGIGAMLEGFDFIGIEMEEEYLKIAEARIEAWKEEEEEQKAPSKPSKIIHDSFEGWFQ